MPDEYDNELRGALFSKEKKNDKQPDFDGQIVIGGTEYRLAAWRRKSKKGVWYMSLKAQAPEGAVAAQPVAQTQAFGGEDNDCPF